MTAKNNAKNEKNNIFARPYLSDKRPDGYDIITETKLKKPIAPAQNHSGKPASLKLSTKYPSGALPSMKKNIMTRKNQKLFDKFFKSGYLNELSFFTSQLAPSSESLSFMYF